MYLKNIFQKTKAKVIKTGLTAGLLLALGATTTFPGQTKLNDAYQNIQENKTTIEQSIKTIKPAPIYIENGNGYTHIIKKIHENGGFKNKSWTNKINKTPNAYLEIFNKWENHEKENGREVSQLEKNTNYDATSIIDFVNNYSDFKETNLEEKSTSNLEEKLTSNTILPSPLKTDKKGIYYKLSKNDKTDTYWEISEFLIKNKLARNNPSALSVMLETKNNKAPGHLKHGDKIYTNTKSTQATSKPIIVKNIQKKSKTQKIKTIPIKKTNTFDSAISLGEEPEDIFDNNVNKTPNKEKSYTISGGISTSSKTTKEGKFLSKTKGKVTINWTPKKTPKLQAKTTLLGKLSYSNFSEEQSIKKELDIENLTKISLNKNLNLNFGKYSNDDIGYSLLDTQTRAFNPIDNTDMLTDNFKDSIIPQLRASINKKIQNVKGFSELNLGLEIKKPEPNKVDTLSGLYPIFEKEKIKQEIEKINISRIEKNILKNRTDNLTLSDNFGKIEWQPNWIFSLGGELENDSNKIINELKFTGLLGEITQGPIYENTLFDMTKKPTITKNYKKSLVAGILAEKEIRANNFLDGAVGYLEYTTTKDKPFATTNLTSKISSSHNITIGIDKLNLNSYFKTDLSLEHISKHDDTFIGTTKNNKHFNFTYHIDLESTADKLSQNKSSITKHLKFLAPIIKNSSLEFNGSLGLNNDFTTTMKKPEFLGKTKLEIKLDDLLGFPNTKLGIGFNYSTGPENSLYGEIDAREAFITLKKSF
jgi:hypothetical protein